MAEITTDKGKTELLRMLHERMRKEQQKYRKWLLSQNKEEILKLAPQYYVQEQAVKEIGNSAPHGRMGERYLYTEQITVLLRSRTPLADICREYFSDIDLYSRYEFVESIRAAIDNCANDLLREEFLERRDKGVYTREPNNTYITDNELEDLLD